MADPGGHEAPPQELDVAVIGGGVAGIYAAWRLRSAVGPDLGPALRDLARDNGRLRVALFEYSHRIGGRLFSLTMPGVPHTPVELGGMRFLSIHRRVSSLVEHFRLETRELPVEDPLGRNIFYLRGQHFTGSDWDRLSFSPPYRLERGERARSPGNLLIEVALRHRAAVELYPERYRDLGFWNLLLDELSDQAYQLIRAAGGYETIVSNWNAAEAIPFLLADFAPGSRYLAVSKGFEELPLEMERRFRGAGGRVCKGHRLHQLVRGDSGIELVLDKGDPALFRFGRRLQQEVRISARHVILAIPRRAMEMLHPDSFVFDKPCFEDYIRSVLPQPGFKIFAAYRRPWWQLARQVTAGRSVTDLPLRQCYYWVTGTAAGSSNSILMASYNDGASVEYWAGLARRPERYLPPPEACPPGVSIPENLRDAIAPAPLIAEMQKQLCELHGLRAIDDWMGAQIIPPYFAVFRDWSQEPFGGGWHFWKIGANSAQIARQIRRPLPGLPLYVCGEAWSCQQGWVEGALETTDDVLEQELRLPRPQWLKI